MSVFPPGVSFSKAPGFVLMAPGKVCDRAECRRSLFFHFSQFLELSVYRGSKGEMRDKQNVLKKLKGKERRGVARPICPKELGWK